MKILGHIAALLAAAMTLEQQKRPSPYQRGPGRRSVLNMRSESKYPAAAVGRAAQAQADRHNAATPPSRQQARRAEMKACKTVARHKGYLDWRDVRREFRIEQPA